MTPPPDPNYLQNRYNIMDMLMAIFMPAFVASVWPVENPDARVVVFFPALALACCSAWWSATLVHSFKIKRLWKRIAVHLYTYLSFTSLVALIVLPGILSDSGSWPAPIRWVCYFLMIVAVPLMLSVAYLENARCEIEKSSIDEALGAQPMETMAETAKSNLKRLIAAKKQEQ